MRRFIHFFRDSWHLALLATASYFAFPFKEGMKMDPAVYGALAKNILRTGQWWPLSLTKDFFPFFFDHPPGVIWAMALTMGVSPENPWFVHLFSRLCGLCSLYVLVQTMKLADPRWGMTRSFISVLLLLSWGQWLKYTGAGQLEGPLALCLSLILYVLVQDETTKVLNIKSLFMIAFASFLGFLFKGVFILSALFGVGVLFLFRRRLSLLWLSLSGLGGVCVSLFLLFLLDHVSHTEFLKNYFFKQVLGTTVTGAGREATALKFGLDRIFSAIRDFFILEIRFAPLWSIVLWGVVIHLFVEAIRKCRLNLPCLVAIVWCVAMAPICLSAFKLPHWTTPFSVLGAFILALWMQPSWVERFTPWIRSSALKSAVVVGVLLLAILPYPTRSHWPRGEEWAIQSQFIRNTTDESEPVRIVRHPQSDGLWVSRVYTSFYILGYRPVLEESLETALNTRCQNGVLVGPNALMAKNEEALIHLGWSSFDHQEGAFRFYRCILTPLGAPP